MFMTVFMVLSGLLALSPQTPANAAGPDAAPAAAAAIEWPGAQTEFHGYACHNFTVDGCAAHVVEPKAALPGRPWVWRTMFWDAFPSADIALLDRGYHVAFIDVGNTFGCPDAMKRFDVFYQQMTQQYGLSKKPALEGLSRGGLYAYRWAYVNTDKVGCIYGDAPVCDMKSWPGGKGKGSGSPADWQAAIRCYHFASEQEMMDFKGNPIDILAPIAAAHIPIIHVDGLADSDLPPSENTDIVRERYMAMGGLFVLISKEGCKHHPHGLADPTPVVNFIVAYTAGGDAAREALPLAPAPGSVTVLTPDQWSRK